jgi:hypothetical protein
MAQAYGEVRSKDDMAISDVITVAFFLLAGPGEYNITISDNAAFTLQDISL